MGPIREPGRDWDVITFNFGLWDDTTSKAHYQQNLRHAIAQLKRSSARLIWVTSTPIDYGYHLEGPENRVVPRDQRAEITRPAEVLEGRVPGRMRLQNEWAEEVLQDYPEIEICDLYQVVTDGKQSLYLDWWYNKSIKFTYRQSIPLARTLARHILRAAGLPVAAINPLSVHSAQLPKQYLREDPDASGQSPESRRTSDNTSGGGH